MNWFEMVNKATEYIENHITDDVVLEDIAKECNVSYYYFVKTFTMLTGYTLKEYIRNRRITLASYEVSNTDHRILDIAVKYGYGSNEAFSRAFKQIHGINPSDARKRAIFTYTHFPVLRYDIPKQSILSMSYEIIRDVEYALIGKNTKMHEQYGYFDDARVQQLDLIHKFKSEHPSDEMLYQVHHHLSKDFTSYDFFVGYEQSKIKQKEGLESITFIAPKAVSFLSKGLDKNLIDEIKIIIYNEWRKNGFQSDCNCEIEIVIPKPKDKVDFYYIVSIH
ncbi:MAG: helix-turn-helix transcriptional regulator [Bacilli bacterium]|nr:helix-turn-helix transcriptional regulator [Bacilli bacterium]MBN2696618.1 helix-turn-helix transcriptional regulator [Bacilli bacterium]